MIAIRYFVTAASLETTAAVMGLLMANETSEVITAVSQLVISTTGLLIALVGLWRTLHNRAEIDRLHGKMQAVESSVAASSGEIRQAPATPESRSAIRPPSPAAPAPPPPPPQG